LWSFREKKRFCWQENILSFFSKAVMCYDPKIVIKELSLSYLSRRAPLRAGICGVSGGNKGSAGRKIFFCDLSKLSWTEELKVSLFKIKGCGDMPGCLSLLHY
jgi:hypothetical protein